MSQQSIGDVLGNFFRGNTELLQKARQATAQVTPASAAKTSNGLRDDRNCHAEQQQHDCRTDQYVQGLEHNGPPIFETVSETVSQKDRFTRVCAMATWSRGGISPATKSLNWNW